MSIHRRTELAKLRRDSGFSQESLAEHLGIGRTTVARWERGEGGVPRPALAARLAQTLGVDASELRRLFGENESAEHQAGDSAGVGADSPDVVADEARLRTVLERPSGIDAGVLATLRREVDRLDAEYDAAPSSSLLAAAGECLARISFLRSTAGGTTERALLTLEADAATLMGVLIWDASQRRQHAVARSYFEQAITAAREIGYRVAESYALLRISYLALYGQDDPAAGLLAADHARQQAPGESAVLEGLTTLHMAEGHAMLGRRAECEQALSAAEASFGQVHGGDEAVRFYSSSQLDRMAGSCYLFLGQPKRAASVLETAAASASGSASKAKAIMLGNLGLAYGRQGRIDQSAASLHAGIDVLEQNRGGGGMKVITQAALELRPWRDEPVVLDLHDRLLTLAGT